ncbi:YccF domain-containing protein [Magnetospirillum aberrantis]|uniref:Inner membrane protein YccF n=1 Tax=Magnetospirillum aberrantis SpK TaxID=908842 RepID=A0A7C9UX11_9PROT|nr:YccF domain-containing protein [Magnetospirillum aberrantis]NFV78514.1 YccF domain-containing protein [Magnetospirillum aberrantis SpK]
MSLILNIIWVVFGGLVMALGWLLAAVIMAVTIIGLPWARACFNIALFALWPFGKEAVSRKVLTGKDDIGTGTLGLVGNVVWFLLAGIWLAIGHIMAAITCALTIIGIPLAVGHLKLANVALFPVGKTIVDKEMAEEARRRAARQELDTIQRP